MRIICTRCKKEVKDILNHYELNHPEVYEQYLNTGDNNGQKEKAIKTFDRPTTTKAN